MRRQRRPERSERRAGATRTRRPGLARARLSVGALAALLMGGASAGGQELKVEERPVQTKADGPCFDLLTTGSQRYADCGNGTVYDTLTGLLWLKDVACSHLGSAGLDVWIEARRDVADLQQGLCGLTDGSQPGDWRLPTEPDWFLATELGVILDCVSGGAGGPPSLTDDTGTACYGMGAGSSFTGMPADRYWASESYAPDPGDAPFVDLETGTLSLTDKEGIVLGPLGIWPVRDGGGPGPPGPVVVEGGVVETKIRQTCLPNVTNLTQRYADCGDGTVLDLHTQLVWLADASCSDLTGTDHNGKTSWPGALAAAMALSDGACGLTDGSQPGDWRLATGLEWHDTVERAVDLGCVEAGPGAPPSLTDRSGVLCDAAGLSLFSGIETRYWVDAILNSSVDEVVVMLTISGSFDVRSKAEMNFVWPVRRR